MTSTGYIVPANTEVAPRRPSSTRRRSPTHAIVFSSSIRNMVVPPFISDRVALVDAVTPLLERLVTAPGVLDLELTTEQIDEASRPILVAGGRGTRDPLGDRVPDGVIRRQAPERARARRLGRRLDVGRPGSPRRARR